MKRAIALGIVLLVGLMVLGILVLTGANPLTVAAPGDELGRLPVTITVVPGSTVRCWSDDSITNRAVVLHLGQENEQWTARQTTLHVTTVEAIGVIFGVEGVPPGAVTFSPETIAMEVGVVYEVIMTVQTDAVGAHEFDIVPREL